MNVVLPNPLLAIEITINCLKFMICMCYAYVCVFVCAVFVYFQEALNISYQYKRNMSIFIKSNL